MRGIPPALPLAVNSKIRSIIEKECMKRNISASFKERLLIVRDEIEGKSKYSTTKKLGISKRMVNLWRSRWSASIAKLIQLSEQGQSGSALKDHEILELIKGILSDAPRSGTPKRITMSQKALIVALVCDKPEQHGIQMSNWTHEMLAHAAISKGIIDRISSRHVGNILKKKS